MNSNENLELQVSLDQDAIARIEDTGNVIRASVLWVADAGEFGNETVLIEMPDGTYWIRWTDNDADDFDKATDLDTATEHYEAQVRDTYPLTVPGNPGVPVWDSSDVDGVPTRQNAAAVTTALKAAFAEAVSNRDNGSDLTRVQIDGDGNLSVTVNRPGHGEVAGYDASDGGWIEDAVRELRTAWLTYRHNNR